METMAYSEFLRRYCNRRSTPGILSPPNLNPKAPEIYPVYLTTTCRLTRTDNKLLLRSVTSGEFSSRSCTTSKSQYKPIKRNTPIQPCDFHTAPTKGR